ncbi:MAG: polymorphic toxin type 24 domain-containing protein [Cruoricaptor ignavus]|nr:polymorphic toxin type 24 domain-containing protein [Cruoricaptor ignavus]
MEHIESLTAVALIHKAGGKMSNKLTPNKEAAGDHSSFSRDKNGNIYKYETYEKTKTGHFNPTKRFDGGKPDGSSGSPHIDKKSGQSVTTPHVQDKSGNTRKPTNDELPRNKRFN